MIWSILGLRAFYYVLNTVRMAFASHDNQLHTCPRRRATAIGIAMTGLIYLILRRSQGGSMRTLITLTFLASVPVAFTYAYVNFAAFYLVAQTSSMMQELSELKAKHETAWAVISGLL